jgi:LmbE family N-acetylglucosaminyl deacetylase
LRLKHIVRASLLACTIALPANAQRPNEDYRGVAATGLAIRKLETTKRVLVIGAHPDDEDTQLLAALSLAQGADVAYLSLTRGEGGQNSIGGELGPALGILRTGELLAARELDLSRQFFTRAYDFGFSKNAEEAFRHWPRDSVLADVVSVVRRYKPDVIVSIFTGTPRDGHGQHQVAGMLAREAFVAAADPARFPALGKPHRTLKLFQATGYRQGEPTQVFATGVMDPLLGRSFAQIAAESRSRHRSQDMGQAQALGPRSTSARLVESRVPVSDSTMFSGIDTTLSTRAARTGEQPRVVQALARYDASIATARAALSAFTASRVADILAQSARELGTTILNIVDADLRFAADQELATLNGALTRAAGIVVDATTSTERIVPGSDALVELTVWNGGDQPVNVVRLEPTLPAGWRFASADTITLSSTLLPGEMMVRKFRVSVPRDAVISQPYFLMQPRAGDVYAWPTGGEMAGLPFSLPAVRATALIQVRGIQVATVANATYRVVDPRQGEVRRAVHVTPAFALHAEPATAVVPLGALAAGAKRTIDASVEVTSNGRGGTVVVKAIVPNGWQAAPREVTLRLGASGATQSAALAIEPPRNTAAGRYEIRFIATDSAGRTYELDQREVDYAHIVNRLMYEPAVTNVTVLDATFARGLRVGYVVGVDAPVAHVLTQMGITVDELDASALANADLSGYDAIVVGSRAYEIRDDLVAHNSRLLDYARKGGHLLVLYQQYEFIQGGFAPFALTLNRPHDRITDEDAAVRILDPGAHALTHPNRITPRDFENWVQERSLYMPRTWAAEYKPLLAMNDPGEPAQRGAILTAPFGEGHYTYSGLAFFRQIPAGVPGALRLFINLLSMGVTDGAI